MRLLFWGLVAVAFFYGAYSVMVSAWQWFQVSGVVDEQLELGRSARDAGPAERRRDTVAVAPEVARDLGVRPERRAREREARARGG